MYKVFVGSSVDEAINNGLSSLNVTEDDVKIDVLESGSSGFLGFGKKDAEVQLTVINPELKAYGSIDALLNSDHVKKADQEPASKVPVKEETEEVEPEESVHTSTDKHIEDEVAPVEAETLAHEEAKVMHEETKEETKTEDAVDHVQEADEAYQAEEVVSESDAGDDIMHAAKLTEQYISNVVAKMDIPNTTEISIDRNEVTITFEAEKSAKIIGKRGSTLNALQELAHTYFNGHYKHFGLVFLDVENYRAKRKEILENLAINMSKKAIRTNQPVKLEPMPSFERKIMHNVLTDIHNIETYSEGQDPNRYIVITKS